MVQQYADAQAAISAIVTGRRTIETIGDSWNDNYDVVCSALELQTHLPGNSLRHVSRRLRGNENVARLGLFDTCANFEFLPDEFRDDDFFVHCALEHDGELLRYASSRVRGDPEYVAYAMRHSPYVLAHATVEFRENRKFIVGLLDEDRPVPLELVDPRFRIDRYVLYRMAEFDASLVHSILGSVDQSILLDVEIVNAVLMHNPAAYRYIEQILRNDVGFVLEAVRMHPDVILYIDERFKSRYGIVRSAVEANGLALRHIGEPHRTDPTLELVAVRSNGLAIQYVRPVRWSEHAFVIEAATQNAGAFAYSDYMLQTARGFVLAAVRANGNVLGFANFFTVDGRKVSMTVDGPGPRNFAVRKTTGHPIDDPIQAFSDDKEIVLAAVTTTGSALMYASMRLREDWDVCTAALTNDADAMAYVLNNLRNCKKFLLDLVRVNPAVAGRIELLSTKPEFVQELIAANPATAQYIRPQ